MFVIICTRPSFSSDTILFIHCHYTGILILHYLNEYKKSSSKDKHFMYLHVYYLEEAALGHTFIPPQGNWKYPLPLSRHPIEFLNYIFCLGHHFKILFHILIITGHSCMHIRPKVHHGKRALHKLAYYAHSCTLMHTYV